MVQQNAVFLPHGSATPLPARLNEVDPEDAATDESESVSIVSDYELSANYPNPFNPSTTIKFAMPEAGKVTLKVFSLTGQLVQALVDGEMLSARHGESDLRILQNSTKST